MADATKYHAELVERIVENDGRLIIPRDTVTGKRRLVTEKQIEDIIKAFTPGNSGVYDYRETKV